MDIAIGGMASLLPKLAQLLKEEYKLQKSAEQDVIFLRSELSRMHVSLSNLAAKPRDALSQHSLLWASEVRELSHDIEDLVDNFLVSADGSVPPPEGSCFKVLAARMASLFKMAKARRDVATAMEGVKGKVQEVAARDDRYSRHDGDGVHVAAADNTRIPGTGTIPAIDPNLLILFEKQKTVGMDDARDVIIHKLLEADDASNDFPKTLSIVGFGGLGKTTLAKAVYDKLREDFDIAAFVPVSRKPVMRNVLKDLLYRLDNEKFNSSKLSNLDEPKLINELRQSLQAETDGKRKRYLVVIDDIWTVEDWAEIKCVFMDTNCGSRIITTTRNVGVANTCCSADDDLIHKMKPLSEGDSQRLFYKRIFADENGCPSHLKQVSRDILKKCDGVPLAIITLASHLASNQPIISIDKWLILLKSIGRGLAKDGSMKNMKDILLFSYYELSAPLKTCFLYLSIFPAGCRIDKGRLIRRWIAEGFLQGNNYKGLFELGESCFNELINKSMIQPIDIDVDGRAQACRVHDMMLDVICDLSSEENFVTILDVMKEETSVHTKVRRLSAQKQMEEVSSAGLATMCMSQVRSFTIFSVAADQVLPLSRFGVLRVLDLEGCDLYTSNSNFMAVVNLLHLRYLGLAQTGLDKIPEGIGKLLLLQILDLSRSNVIDLPASVARLRNLICLYLGNATSLPVGFWKLTTLEELTDARFREDGVELEKLRYLIKLRVFSFYWPECFGADELGVLVKSLGKLSNLESLEIYTARETNMDAMESWEPSPCLRRLKFQAWFQTLPKWINPKSLVMLSFLYIVVREVRPEDIQNLGDLPSLRYLELRSILSYGDTAAQRFMLRPDAFPCLRECYFNHFILEPSAFTQGAMPMVQELRFSLAVSDILGGGDSSGILSLHSLKQVEITLYHEENFTEERHYKATDALRRVADHHPNPRLQLDIQEVPIHGAIRLTRQLIGSESKRDRLVNFLSEVFAATSTTPDSESPEEDTTAETLRSLFELINSHTPQAIAETSTSSIPASEPSGP